MVGKRYPQQEESERTNSTCRDGKGDTALLPLTAIWRTNSTSFNCPPPHQHSGGPSSRPDVAMFYPMPPRPLFPVGSERADGFSMLPIPPLSAAPPSLAELYNRLTKAYPDCDSQDFQDTAHEHHRQQQLLWQDHDIKHHDHPDISLPLLSASMSVGSCFSGTTDTLASIESMDDWNEDRQEQANAVYNENLVSMTGWENQHEKLNSVNRYNENTDDGIASLPDCEEVNAVYNKSTDCAANEESTGTTGKIEVVDMETLSQDSVQPAIQLHWQEVRHWHSKAIRAAIPEDRTREENEFVQTVDDERRNVKNNRGRENTRDRKIRLQEILAKSSDQPEDRTQEEKMFVQACEQARIIKNRRSRARLKERKNKLQALLAKSPDQRSVVEQAYLEQQTTAMKRKNTDDRLRHARKKKLASEPEQQRSNLKIAPRGPLPYLKIGPRGSLPSDMCSTPSSHILPPPLSQSGVADSKLQGHSKHNGSYNGLIHKDAAGNAGSDCANGDNSTTTLDVLVAVSPNLPRVNVPSAVDVPSDVIESRKAARRSKARAKNAAKRRRVVEIKTIKPEDRTPGDNAFLQAVGQQRKSKNDRSRTRGQEAKDKLQTILAKSPDQRSTIEKAFLEQQKAAKQRKNLGDCLRRMSVQLQVLGVSAPLDLLDGSAEENKTG